MSKTYKAVGRLRGTEEWKDITHNGEKSYCDETGLPQFKQMVDMMAMHFTRTEYKIVETTL